MSPLVRQRRTESSAPGKAHGQFLGEDCLIASPGAQDMNLMPTWGHPADVPPHSGKFYSSDGIRHIGGIDKPEGVDAFHTTFISLKQLRCTYADCAYNIFVPTW